jgi:hypothetical protein
MEVTHIYDIQKLGTLFTGKSRWEDEVYHRIGDVLTCGSKKWKVIAVSHFRQGCFGIPQYRLHSLKLEPIDHEDFPQVGDVLV